MPGSADPTSVDTSSMSADTTSTAPQAALRAMSHFKTRVPALAQRGISANDAFERILGHLRDDHHLRTDLIGATEDAIIRLALRRLAARACGLRSRAGAQRNLVD
jgi:hypothetical protein